MMYRCLEAALAWPGEVEVLDLHTIAPWVREAMLAPVARIRKCLAVHEDFATWFLGPKSALIATEAYEFLDACVERLAPLNCPIPYNRGLTEQVIPGVLAISERLAGLLAF